MYYTCTFNAEKTNRVLKIGFHPENKIKINKGFNWFSLNQIYLDKTRQNPFMGRFCLIGSQWWFGLYKFTIDCNLINTCITFNTRHFTIILLKKNQLTLANISAIVSTFGACCSSDFSILPVRATRACSIWTWLNGYHWLRPWAPNSWRATSIPCMTPRPNVIVRTIWGSVETFSRSSVGTCLRVDTIAGEEKW